MTIVTTRHQNDYLLYNNDEL